MKRSELKELIREMIDKESSDDPLYVEYVGEMKGEVPFTMKDGKKYEYVWAKYPNGKKDIGVYAYSGDVVYGYKAFRTMFNLNEDRSTIKKSEIKKWIKEIIQEISSKTPRYIYVDSNGEVTEINQSPFEEDYIDSVEGGIFDGEVYETSNTSHKKYTKKITYKGVQYNQITHVK